MTLNDGFQVKVPNDILVVPGQSVGPSGDTITNASTQVVLMGANLPPNENGTPLLGTQFFSSV